MQFTDLSFLPLAGVLLILYYTVPGKFQWVLLLSASLALYLCSGAANTVFLLSTILSSWFFAVWMDRTQGKYGRKQAKRKNRIPAALCLALNFGMLALCKVRFHFHSVLLPMGISFFVFQATGYVLDVYRGTVKAEHSPWKVALFLSWYPQLVQGPISRFRTLSSQLAAPHDYDGRQVSFGLQRMLWGYFKKLVIADRIAPAVQALRGPEYTGASFLLLTVFYALQIYGDFTGGIDIALGLSEAFGISLPENFQRPFFSKSIAEYWRRWHITLGQWMKDYLFYPVSVSAPLRTLSAIARDRWGTIGKRLPVYAASTVTWLCTGLWHGLTPNFLLWGMLNCAVIVVSEELTPLYRRFHKRFSLKQRKWYGVYEMLRTFLLMNFIRAVDLFPDPGEYFRRLGSLLSFAPVSLSQLGLTGTDWLILIPGCAVMLCVSVIQEKYGSLRGLLWEHTALRYALTFGLFLTVLLTGRYGIGYDSTNFIYNQF